MSYNHDTDVKQPETSDPPCHLVRELLPEYATAEALGQAPEDLYPGVAAHLSRCLMCRAELNELRELILAAYTGRIEPAAAYPEADLSFLPRREPAAQAPEQAWRIDDLGRLVVSFSQALLSALRQPALAGAARGALLYTYALGPAALPDREVRIEVFVEDAGRDLGFVRVGVEHLSRDPLDQPPNQVVLRAGDVAWHGETDESGYAAFESVPLALLPQLEVEITTRG